MKNKNIKRFLRVKQKTMNEKIKRSKQTLIADAETENRKLSSKSFRKNVDRKTKEVLRKRERIKIVVEKGSCVKKQASLVFVG